MGSSCTTLKKETMNSQRISLRLGVTPPPPRSHKPLNIKNKKGVREDFSEYGNVSSGALKQFIDQVTDYQLYKEEVYGVECCLFRFSGFRLLKLQEENKCTKQFQALHP